MSAPSPVRRGRGWLWLAGVSGLSGAVAAIAELSGANDPGPATMALWLAVAVIALSLPAIVLVIESRLETRQATATARAEATCRDESRLREIRTHFVSRGRGVTPASSRREWYFTGRQRALRELAAWLNDAPATSGTALIPGDRAGPASDPRARVVTGGPGSGKSAVLGRVVTFGSEPLNRGLPAGLVPDDPALVPRPGSVRSVVHARGCTADQVAALIADDLGLPARTTADLLATLAEREPARQSTVAPDRPTGIVVDAVDEADDPDRLVADLLEPLASGAAAWHLRLLVGTRTGADRALVRRFGPAIVEVPLDDPAYFDPADLAEYGRRCLVAAGEPAVASPYRYDDDLAGRVAAAVARRAGTSFLIVQLTCIALASRPDAVDVGEPTWQEQLPDSVGAAMDRFLADFGADQAKVRDLLLPLAFAAGAGLSDSTAWAAIATALGTGRYAAQDVTWLLWEPRAASLLTAADDGGEPAYRLFHEALGEHLRRLTTTRMSLRAVHRHITEALIARVPRRTDVNGPDWIRAGGYVRTHLATHAAAGEVIQDLVTDPLFLVAAESDRLIGALPNGEWERSRLSDEMRDVVDTVHRAGRTYFTDDDGDRAAYLQMAARKVGAGRLANGLAALPVPKRWTLPWARWRTVSPGAALIGSHEGYVREVAVGTVGRTDVVASITDSSLSMWRAVNGGLVACRAPDRLRDVRSVTVVPTGVVTLHRDGEFRMHDVDTGETSGLAVDTVIDIPSFCRYLSHEGRDLLLVADTSTAQLWDLTRREPAAPPVKLASKAKPLTAAVVGGRPLMLANSGPTVQAWDLVSGATYGEGFQPHEHAPPGYRVWSAVLTEVDGHVVAVVGGPAYLPVVRWDLDAGQRSGADLPGLDIGTMSLAAAGDLLCAGGGNGSLRLWSWPACGTLGPDIAAHEGGVDALAIIDLGDGQTFVSGGRDGATRLWLSPPAPDPADLPAVARLLPVRAGGSDRLLAATGTQLILLDPADGATLAERAAATCDLAPVGQAGASVAVGLQDGSVHIVDTATLRTRRRFPVTAPGEISGVATAPGRLLVSTHSGHLHVWDTEHRRPSYPAVEVGPDIYRAQHLRDIVVTLGSESIHSTELATGRPGGWRLAGGCHLDTYVRALAIGPMSGRTVAVGIGAYSHLHVWDVADGSLLLDTTIKDGHQMELYAITVATLYGRQVVVSAGYAGAVAVWDLDGQVGELIELGSPVYAITVTGEDTIVAGGPAGVLAVTVTPACVLTSTARRDLGVRLPAQTP